MPAPQTPAQKLLIDELGEGPGSRLLLIASVRRGCRNAGRAVAGAAARRSRRDARVRTGRQRRRRRPRRDPRAPAPVPLSAVADARYAALDAAFLRDAARRARAGSRLARRGADRTAAAVRSDAGNAEAGREPGSRRTRRSACTASGSIAPAARRCWSRRRTRPASIRPDSRPPSTRSRPPSPRCAATAHTQLTLTGPGAFSVEIGGRTAARGAAGSARSTAIGLRAAAVGRLPQLEDAAARRAAAGQRGPGGPGRGRAGCSTACTASPSRSASP